MASPIAARVPPLIAVGLASVACRSEYVIAIRFQLATSSNSSEDSFRQPKDNSGNVFYNFDGLNAKNNCSDRGIALHR